MAAVAGLVLKKLASMVTPALVGFEIGDKFLMNTKNTQIEQTQNSYSSEHMIEIIFMIVFLFTLIFVFYKLMKKLNTVAPVEQQ